MEGFTAFSLFKEISNLLSDAFSEQEIQSLQRMIFEKKLGLQLHEIYLNPNLKISEIDTKSILDIVSELISNKPIQYIFGEADFFGLVFKVAEDVLIPRPETEELVDWIIKSVDDNPLSILDIGTGSGCIAVSLAANLPKAKITAIDISNSALEVARYNAKANSVDVDFFLIDILDSNQIILNYPFDIIVSNPPYIRESEKKLMKPNVLEHEPYTALFVSDIDPLIFYREIAQKSLKLLKPGGKVYCELNEALADETCLVFAEFGYTKIEVRKDLNGKNRMIKAELCNGE
ncbi:MAG: peptide chain release factor N(5)-glutamine methyltransferase [Tenuifilaceae bacterium]